MDTLDDLKRKLGKLAADMLELQDIVDNIAPPIELSPDFLINELPKIFEKQQQTEEAWRTLCDKITDWKNK